MDAGRPRWVLGVSLLGCAAALLMFLSMSGATEAGTPVSAPSAQAGVPPTPPTDGEVAALRTASSRTYRTSDGTYQARIWAQPVNYRSDDQWKAIDTNLKSDGSGGLETTATPVPVTLPQSLDDPAKVASGSRWASFRLLGADGDVAPAADGSTATYSDVLDGVDVAYDAQSSGVKETLTLADATAPATYRYALDASSGLTPALRDNGTVVFHDAEGQTRFWLPAPTVQEHGAAAPSTDHVAYRLSEDRQTLTVAVDPEWLAAAAFPVRVDPTVYWGDAVSCTLASGSQASTASCGSSSLKVGHDSSRTYRSVLRFPDISQAIPRDASVMHSYLGLYFASQTATGASTTVNLSGLAKTVASGATWNTYDGVHAWTAAGGDVVADPQAEPFQDLPSYTGSYSGWDLSRLVQSWIHDPTTNKGVLLKAVNETTNNVLRYDGHTGANGPSLMVDYEEHPGYESDQTYESVAFDGTSKMSVNAASGNLAVDSTDLSIPGVGGLDLKVGRTFNGKNLGNQSGTFGSAWTLSVDGAGYFNRRTWWNDKRTLFLNGGAIYRFDRDYAHDTSTTDAYLSPANLNADLVSDSDTGEATLTYRDTGIVYTYAQSWDGEYFGLKRIADPAGHHIDIAPRSGHPDQIGTITDTNNTVYTFNYGSNSQLTKIAGGSTEWKYATTIVSGHNLLTGYTNPANQTTAYHYNAALLPGTWDSLDRVTDPEGNQYQFEYGADGDYSQATAITQDFADSRPNTVNRYDYTPDPGVGHSCDASALGRTVAKNALGDTITYCYNTSAQVFQTFKDDPGTGGDGIYTPETAAVGDSTLGVNVANGNLLLTRRDADVSASGAPSLDVDRAYNSVVTKANVAGIGQQLSVAPDVALFFTSSATIVYRDATGFRTVFARQAGGGWAATAATATGATLTVDGSGHYVVDDGSAQRTFSTSGELLSALASDGTSVSYSSTTIAGKRRVAAITAGSASTTFTYDATTARLTGVHDSSGSNVAYGYDTAGRLTSVVGPEGTTGYGYDANGRVGTLTAADGTSATVAYDTSGRVSGFQVFAAGATTASTSETFTYQPAGTLCAGSAGQTSIDDGSRPVIWCWDANGVAFYGGDDATYALGDVSEDTCYVDPDDPDTYCGGADDLPYDETPMARAGDGGGGAAARSVTGGNWGISDQNAFMFSDSRFTALGAGVGRARIILPWNIAVGADYASAPADVTAAKDWITAATNAGKAVLVSFERCRKIPAATPSADIDTKAERDAYCSTHMPTQAQYTAAMTAFLGDSVFGTVAWFTPWNEPNHKGYQPTAGIYEGASDNSARASNSAAFRAGKLYNILLKACRTRCRVSAGDFLDSNMGTIGSSNYGQRYLRQYRNGAGAAPQSWAWHAYSDANERPGQTGSRIGLRWRRLDAFLAAIGTKHVLLTEQGVEYRVGDKDKFGNEHDPSRANAVMQSLLDEAPARGAGGGQIDQLFVYQWNGGPLAANHFDAGLTERVASPGTTPGATRNILKTFCTKVGGSGCATL